MFKLKIKLKIKFKIKIFKINKDYILINNNN